MFVLWALDTCVLCAIMLMFVAWLAREVKEAVLVASGQTNLGFTSAAPHLSCMFAAWVHSQFIQQSNLGGQHMPPGSAGTSPKISDAGASNCEVSSGFTSDDNDGYFSPNAAGGENADATANQPAAPADAANIAQKGEIVGWNLQLAEHAEALQQQNVLLSQRISGLAAVRAGLVLALDEAAAGGMA